VKKEEDNFVTRKTNKQIINKRESEFVFLYHHQKKKAAFFKSHQLLIKYNK